VLEEDGAYGLSGPLVYIALIAPILIQDWPTYVRQFIRFFFCIVLVDADGKDGQPVSRVIASTTARN